MQQLATNLVLLLEKQALQAVQADLLTRQGRSSNEVNTENELANVKLDDLALSLLMHMNPLPLDKRPGNWKYTRTNAFYVQMLAIIAAFDAVDVDNRGVINFTDFTNFCLRVGRLLLKPSIKHTLKNYLLCHDNKTTLYPADRMRYINHIQMLFVFDADTPRARLYNRDQFISRVNPILAAKRALHTSVSTKLTYYEKMELEKQATQIRITEKELDEFKGSILDVAFVESTKQYVFTSSHSYLIFIDGANGLYDDKGEMKVVGHLKTAFPMHTLHYSKVLDMIMAIPGEGSDHVMEMYEPRTRKLKFRINKHDTKVLSLCEVILDKSHPLKDHYFVSSSMDGKLIFWPTAPLSSMLSKLHTNRLLRMAETVDYDLKGHHHAIHSVVYASHQEVIIGAGFDFEIMAWDPFTRDMCMKFAGHFKSIAGIQIVYTPEERLLSIDETGSLKLWNVSKELGVYGSQEHTFQLQCQQPARIKGFTRTYGDGKGIAVLAEKLYILNLENDYADDLKPMGFGVCPTAGRLFTVFKSSIHLLDIVGSRQVKSLNFLDPDRVSSTDHLLSRGDELRIASTADSNVKGLKLGIKSAGHIDIKDTVTACAIDATGKKVIIGTLDGRVLLFDSFTFGLLKQLTDEDEDNAFRYQGAVAGLVYVDRDELVIAVYSAGAVKIFGACLRHAYAGPKHSTHRPQRKSGGGADKAQEDFIPHSNGGKPPIRPFLLRECDLGVLPDFSVRAVAMSEGHNLIAVLTKSGVIYFYEYLSLGFAGCISIEGSEETPTPASSGDTVKQFVSMRFAPLVPLLVVVDSHNMVHVWTVRPMPFKFILSWNAYGLSHDTRLCSICPNLHWHGLEDIHSAEPWPVNPVTGLVDRFQPMSGTSITSMRCISFSTHCGEEGHEADPGTPSALVRKWIVVFGTDFGQVFTQNITSLVQKSGCMEYIPRPDAFFLAYHKMKPRRFVDASAASAHTSIQRTRMPDEVVPKLQPIRPEDTADVVLQQQAIPQNDRSGTRPTPSLARQQTRKNIKQQKGRKRFDGPLQEYVQGLEGWQVFQSVGIREVAFYDPFFEPANRTRHHAMVADLFPVHDRLPCIFIASDQGQVRLMTLSGVTLGDALEELLETTTKGAKDVEVQPAAAATPLYTPLPSAPFATSIPFSSPLTDHSEAALRTLHEATKDSTFITTIVPVEDKDRIYDEDRPRPGQLSPDTPTATVYVKSESRSLTARKVSIQPKSQTFDFGMSARAMSGKPIGSSIQGSVRRSVDAMMLLLPPCPLVEDPVYEDVLSTSLPAYITPPMYTMPRAPWVLPVISVHIHTGVGETRDKEVLTIAPIVRLTSVQYLYMKDVLSRLLPCVEHEADARFRVRFESFMWDGHNSIGSTDGPGAALRGAPLGKQHSTYMTRFASAENLLQGLNSFLIDKQLDHGPSGLGGETLTTAVKITSMHEKAKGAPRESVLEKIILTMTDREQQIAEMIKSQSAEKWARKNLSHLIDHIQQTSFPSQQQYEAAPGLGTTPNTTVLQNGIWRHFEKEKARGRRAPWEVTSHHVQLDYGALKDEYFSDNKISQANKGLVQNLSTATDLGNVGAEPVPSTPERKCSPDADQDAPDADPDPTAEAIVDVTTLVKTLGDDGAGTSQSLRISISKPQLMDTREASSPTLVPFLSTPQSPLPSPLPLPRARPSTASELRASSSSATSTPQRPRTAQARSKLALVSPTISATPERPSTAQSYLRTQPSPLGSPIVRALSAGGTPTTMRGVQRHAKIDKLINDLDAISIDPDWSRPNTASSRPRTADGTRPAPVPSPVPTPRVEVVTPGVAAQLAFTKNKERVGEIHGKFEDIMLTLRSTSQPYAHYDPLRQKRVSEMAKNRRKQQLRLKVSQEGNTYVEDERFEGIVDVEKEAKKAESKHLLAQSRATGRKTGYGLYKYVDLVKFVHFLQFLQPLDISVYERNVMYFYDEAGTDVSKYVRDQPYFLVDEVLACVEKLLGDSQPTLTLKAALIFFRDEVPRSSKISLFHLIEVVFAMSKGWGVQLRIYMFVVLAHHLYNLMKSALPPPDQRDSPSPPGSPRLDEEDPGSPVRPDGSATSSKLKQHLIAQVQTSRAFAAQEKIQVQRQGSQTTLASTSSMGLPAHHDDHEVPDALDEAEGIAPSMSIESPVEAAIAMAAPPKHAVDPFLNRPSSPALLVGHAFDGSSEGAELDVERFIVYPHPLRGFRQWIIRRKAFGAVVKVLNFWCDGSMESLTIMDLVEIFHSMIPRSELDNYRIMRVLPVAAHRMGLSMGGELNGAALTKIFQNVMEIKVVVG